MNKAAHHNIICFLLSKSFSSSSNSTAPTTIPTLSNIPFTINVKLHSSNYLMWKAQALPYFRSHYLPRSNYIPFSYLDGTIFIPPKEIDFSDSNIGALQKIPNSNRPPAISPSAPLFQPDPSFDPLSVAHTPLSLKPNQSTFPFLPPLPLSPSSLSSLNLSPQRTSQSRCSPLLWNFCSHNHFFPQLTSTSPNPTFSLCSLFLLPLQPADPTPPPNSLHTLPPLHLPLIPLSVAAKTNQPSLSIVLSFLSFSVNQTPHFSLQPADHNKPATHQVFPLSSDFLSPR